MVGEAGAWNYLYETASDVGPQRSDVIDNFFDPSSANYIGDLPHVPAMIAGHSYWLDTSWDEPASNTQAGGRRSQGAQPEAVPDGVVDDEREV